MNLHKRIYFCFSLSLFSFFLSIDRNRRLSSPKSLGCLGFCFSYIKRWRVLVWLPFQLLIVDTRERNVGKGFIYVDFVLIWRTAERIDSPQCIPSIYCCAHGVCVHCTLGAVWWWCIPTDDSHLRFVSLKCHYVSARFAEEATDFRGMCHQAFTSSAAFDQADIPPIPSGREKPERRRSKRLFK
jgi:hypothetical protein